jgi:hypothetical protein
VAVDETKLNREWPHLWTAIDVDTKEGDIGYLYFLAKEEGQVIHRSILR